GGVAQMITAERVSGAVAALLIAVTIAWNGCAPARSAKSVVVGTKDFSETMLLGELVAQIIEARAGVRVERKFPFGDSQACDDGVRSGRIDLYPEYTGTAFAAILKK